MTEVPMASSLAEFQVPIWFWITYHLVIVTFIALDLVAGIRRKEMTLREALKWVGIWVGIGTAFGIVVYFMTNNFEAMALYYAAYVVEYSLSMDNLFVFAVIFSYFSVPILAQPIVLYVGIITAIILRASFIYGGLWLIEQYHWTIFIFGAVLIYSGYKLLKAGEVKVDPARNPIVRAAKKILPIADFYDGSKFIVRANEGSSKRLFTPLILALAAIETTDVVFAFDSVPAVIAITLNFFIAYTSNISAILGLRSLYFVIALTMFRFKYVGQALSMILIFLGVKMILGGLEIVEVPTWISLTIVFSLLGGAILLSIIRKEIKEAVE
ncbi:MAG: TerC/Alx family metal homeostasis membrane protein [Nitrososphaerota archaeon]